MSKELLIISFFKERKICYYIDKKKSTIIFSCLHCGEAAVIKAESTNWNCSKCEKSGNLVSLFHLNEKQIFKEKIFNPRDCKRNINIKINKLLARFQEQSKIHLELQNIKEEFNDLVNRLID